MLNIERDTPILIGIFNKFLVIKERNKNVENHSFNIVAHPFALKKNQNPFDCVPVCQYSLTSFRSQDQGQFIYSLLSQPPRRFFRTKL